MSSVVSSAVKVTPNATEVELLRNKVNNLQAEMIFLMSAKIVDKYMTPPQGIPVHL